MNRKDKTCVVIPSFCNTEEKEKVLLKSIDDIKKLGLDVLLLSNRIILDSKFYKDVNYYLYDNRYLIGDKIFSEWIITHGYKMIQKNLDFGFSVVEQLKTSSVFLQSIGYENVVFINYDIVFSEKDYEDIFRFIEDNYKYDAIAYTRSHDQINPILLMFNISKFFDYFNISIEKFNEKRGFEHYLYEVFYGRNDVEIIDRNILSSIACYDMVNIIDDPVVIYPFNNDDKLSFFIYGIKTPIDISLRYENEKIFINKERLKYHDNGHFIIIRTDRDIFDGNLEITYNNITEVIEVNKRKILEKNG